MRLASSYVNAYEVRTDALEEHFSQIDFTDPTSMTGLEKLSDPEVLLGAMQSERQKPVLEEMQRFASVLEGYTDVVVEILGQRMVASHVRIGSPLFTHILFGFYLGLMVWGGLWLLWLGVVLGLIGLLRPLH